MQLVSSMTKSQITRISSRIWRQWRWRAFQEKTCQCHLPALNMPSLLKSLFQKVHLSYFLLSSNWYLSQVLRDVLTDVQDTVWKSEFIHVQTLIKCLSHKYGILCLTNSSICPCWGLSVMEGRKYFVEHLLCINYSATCFSYAYSLTIKTSYKGRDFSFFFFNYFYLFIFGCVGSSLLCMGFL